VKTSEYKSQDPNVLVKMGPKDKLFNYESKWPIYILHLTDKKGLLNKIETDLQIFEYQKKLQTPTPEELEHFFKNNADITFESMMFEDVMSVYYFFKVNGKIYFYTLGIKGKDKSRVYGRFYFPLEEVISCLSD